MLDGIGASRQGICGSSRRSGRHSPTRRAIRGSASTLSRPRSDRINVKARTTARSVRPVRRGAVQGTVRRHGCRMARRRARAARCSFRIRISRIDWCWLAGAAATFAPRRSPTSRARSSRWSDGYAYGDAIEIAGPTWVRTGGEQDSLSRLLNSGVDYVLMDELVVQYLVASYPEEARTRLSIGTTALLTRPVHLALHRSLPDAGAIIKGFNAQLKRDDHRSHLSPAAARRLDPRRRRWRRQARICRRERSGRLDAAEACLRLVLADADGAAPSAPPEQERYFFGGSVYNGWSSVPDKYKVDHLDRADHTHPTARMLTFSWK